MTVDLNIKPWKGYTTLYLNVDEVVIKVGKLELKMSTFFHPLETIENLVLTIKDQTYIFKKV